MTQHDIPRHATTYHEGPLHTITYQHVPFHSMTRQYIPFHTNAFSTTCHYMPLMPLHDITCSYMPIHIITKHCVTLMPFMPFQTLCTGSYMTYSACLQTCTTIHTIPDLTIRLHANNVYILLIHSYKAYMDKLL